MDNPKHKPHTFISTTQPDYQKRSVKTPKFLAVTLYFYAQPTTKLSLYWGGSGIYRFPYIVEK